MNNNNNNNNYNYNNDNDDDNDDHTFADLESPITLRLAFSGFFFLDFFSSSLISISSSS